jgi:predicted XRE-type DNA-binding protein
MSPFGRSVLAWIKQESLSQRVVARMLGIQERTFSDWMKVGGLPKSATALVKLAALMNSSVDGLLDERDLVAPLRDPKIVREMVRAIALPHVFKKYLAAQEAKSRDEQAAESAKKPAKRKMRSARRTHR